MRIEIDDIEPEAYASQQLVFEDVANEPGQVTLRIENDLGRNSITVRRDELDRALKAMGLIL